MIKSLYAKKEKLTSEFVEFLRLNLRLFVNLHEVPVEKPALAYLRRKCYNIKPKMIPNGTVCAVATAETTENKGE